MKNWRFLNSSRQLRSTIPGAQGNAGGGKMFPFDLNLGDAFVALLRSMIGSARLVRVLAERVQESIFRQRWRKQHPLAKIAPHHDQGLKIRNRVDAFGNHDTAKTVGKINRRLAYRRVGDVNCTVLNEQSVQFEFEERQIPQAGE